MDNEFKNPFDDEEEDIGIKIPGLPEKAAPERSPSKKGEPFLTDEMKTFIDAHWKDLDLMEMTRHIFKDDNLKGTSKEGRLVRQYLIGKGFEYKTTADTSGEEIVLTDEHKEFIMQYAATMKPYEIARILFKKDKLHQFARESLAVQEYIRAQNPVLLKKDDEYTDGEYTPPKTFKAAYKKICEHTGFTAEEDKLNTRTRKMIEKFLEFMNAPRFVQTTTNLKNLSERTIFEAEFIRAVWDKPDLTNEELNLYVSLTNEYVIQDRLSRIMGKLNMMLENVADDPDGRISMGLSDSIKGKSEELHRSLSRQREFTTLLTGKRADRQAKETAKAKNLVSLVEAFRDEQERKALLRFADHRKKLVEEEIVKFESEEDWNARIFGISREEILE